MRNTHVLDMTEDDEQELQQEQLPGVGGSDGGSHGSGRPGRPLPPVATPPTPPPSHARSALPPEDMYDTELAALEAQLNSVPGIQRQAINREISQLQQLQAAAAKTATTPQAPGTPAPPAGTPLPVAYVLATGEPFKTKDGQLMELVSVAFTPSPSDPYFAGVDIWFTGYHGSKTPQLMTSGTTSPVSFLADITGETVTFTVQSFGSTGLSSAFVSAPSATIALDGAAGAPPQPTVTQLLVQTPVGYQFEFSQEAGLAADVVSGYNVYRGTSSSFGSASKVDHIKQDPTNSGTVVWQDSQPSGVTMYYWLTAVNTSGDESAPTACQSGAVVSGSGLNSAGQLVTGTPSTPVSSLDSGASRANTAIDAGNVVVAAGIDLSRGYTNKNLDNVPPGSTYTALPIAATSGTGTATKVNLNSGAGVSGNLPYGNHSSVITGVINSGGAVVSSTPLDGGRALDIGQVHDYVHTGLNSSGEIIVGTAATGVASLDTGASRANTAIDSGNVIVASGVDFARGYTNKHLGNVPDDVTSHRYAAGEVGADKTTNHVAMSQAVGTTNNPAMAAQGTGLALVPEMTLTVAPAHAAAVLVCFQGVAFNNVNAPVNVTLAVYVDGSQVTTTYTFSTIPQTSTYVAIPLVAVLSLSAGPHTVAVYADSGGITPSSWWGTGRTLTVTVLN